MVNSQWIKSQKSVKFPVTKFTPPSLCEAARSVSPESASSDNGPSASEKEQDQPSAVNGVAESQPTPESKQSPDVQRTAEVQGGSGNDSAETGQSTLHTAAAVSGADHAAASNGEASAAAAAPLLTASMLEFRNIFFPVFARMLALKHTLACTYAHVLTHRIDWLLVLTLACHYHSLQVDDLACGLRWCRKWCGSSLQGVQCMCSDKLSCSSIYFPLFLFFQFKKLFYFLFFNCCC